LSRSAPGVPKRERPCRFRTARETAAADPPPGVLKNLGGRALLGEPGLCRAYAGKVLVVYARQLPGNNLGIVV